MLAINDNEIGKYCKYKFINKKYRKQLSYFDCFCSLFHFHNETMNIWTHLLSSLYFLYIFFEKTIVQKCNNIILQIFPFVLFISLLLSSLFHILSCNEKYYHVALSADVTGIFSIISVCVIPTIIDITATDDIVYFQNMYVILYCISTFSLYYIYVKKIYETSKVEHIYQNLGLVISILWWIIPITHLYFQSTYNNFINKLLFWIPQYIYWAFCFFTYAILFPERYFIYKYNWFFYSHALFHIFVTLSAIAHYDRINMIFN